MANKKVVEYVKDICYLEKKQALRKILFSTSLFFDSMFIVFLIVVVATSNKYYALGSLFSIILAVILVKITSKIPIAYIYELYSNSIKIVKKYEYTHEVILETAINKCIRKLMYQQIEDAKRVINDYDMILVNRNKTRMILSFKTVGSKKRYYISPNEAFLKKLEEGLNDIPR